MLWTVSICEGRCTLISPGRHISYLHTISGVAFFALKPNKAFMFGPPPPLDELSVGDATHRQWALLGRNQKAKKLCSGFRSVLLTSCDILDDNVYDGYGHHHVDDFKVHPANSTVVFVVPEISSIEILSPDAVERTVLGDSERVSSKCDSFIIYLLRPLRMSTHFGSHPSNTTQPYAYLAPERASGLLHSSTPPLLHSST